MYLFALCCIISVKEVCFLIELFGSIVCITYLCIVFFMVLDLRLTKIGTQRSPFFMPLLFKAFCATSNLHLQSFVKRRNGNGYISCMNIEGGNRSSRNSVG